MTYAIIGAGVYVAITALFAFALWVIATADDRLAGPDGIVRKPHWPIKDYVMIIGMAAVWPFSPLIMAWLAFDRLREYSWKRSILAKGDQHI